MRAQDAAERMLIQITQIHGVVCNNRVYVFRWLFFSSSFSRYIVFGVAHFLDYIFNLCLFSLTSRGRAKPTYNLRERIIAHLIIFFVINFHFHVQFGHKKITFKKIKTNKHRFLATTITPFPLYIFLSPQKNLKHVHFL